MFLQTVQNKSSRVLGAAVVIIFLAFPVLILLVSSGGSAPFHVAALMGLVCLSIRRPRLPRKPGADERLACLGYAAFTVAVLISLVETGFARGAVRELDVLLRPLWAIPILYLLIRVRTAPALLWFGVSAGAVAVGSSALYEYFTVDNFFRADGSTSAIHFGNTGLLMGFISAVGIPFFRQMGKPWLVIPVLALVFGLLASLLSGSRGGWVALPALAVLLLWHLRRVGYRRVPWIAAAILVVGVGVFLTLPQVGVTDRVEIAVTEYNQYTEKPIEHGDTSVGVRLALWSAAWDMFLENPIFGGGIGYSFNGYLQEQVDMGYYHPSLAHQTMPHNVLLDTLALQGLVGLAGLLMIWSALGIVFLKAAAEQGTELRTLGAAGLMLLVAYMHFGMTDSVMGYGPPLVFFSFYSVLLVYLIAESRVKMTTQGAL